MENHKLIKALYGYRPLGFIGEKIILAKNYEIYIANYECSNINFECKVKVSLFINLISKIRFINRIFRFGIKYSCVISENMVLLADKKNIWCLDLSTGKLSLDHSFSGSRPLSISNIKNIHGFEDGQYYGEYSKNSSKDEVNIWFRNLNGDWSIVHTFPKGCIEHIHAVIPDIDRNLVWVLTGDFGGACGIWVAEDNFLTVKPIIYGDQKFRCTWLEFLDGRIIYATDSQLVRNSLRELVINDEPPLSIFLREINGSSIYSCRVGEHVYFSTAVEPTPLKNGPFILSIFNNKLGDGIIKSESHLFFGKNPDYFKDIGYWKKDKFPMRLFEFGSICFPSGVNPSGYLYVYFNALVGVDNVTKIYSYVD